jgi:hypothetical protein
LAIGVGIWKMFLIQNSVYHIKQFAESEKQRYAQRKDMGAPLRRAICNKFYLYTAF